MKNKRQRLSKPVLPTNQLAGAPITFKWSDDFAATLMDTDNAKLYRAIDAQRRHRSESGGAGGGRARNERSQPNASSFRAKMAIGALLGEWAVCRFEGLVDTSDGKRRVEAAWTSVIAPIFVNDFEYANDDLNHDTSPVEAAYGEALHYLGEIGADYLGSNIYLAEPVMILATLVRHVVPDKKAFDAWLTTTLARTAKAFPRGVEYDEASQLYDASHGPPVPRAFFEPGFKYTAAASKKALAEFLKGLEPARNQYLRSAKDIRKRGWKGTPYTL